MTKKHFILLFLLLATCNIVAQSFAITGKVTDEKGQPLVGANIFLKGTVIGTATNSKGEFELSKLKSDNYFLVISMIGYEKKEINLNFSDTNSRYLTIKLKKESLRVGQVIVTASKHKNEIKNLPVSASVITSERISEKNFITLDQALRYEPGVVVTEDQISIRGSSGYSLGAGTRVLTAIDGIPLYTGDSGEIIWQLIPPSEIDRIEVVKGAASSMYGTTAMGGVINLISKDITSKPLTYIKTFAGAYAKPSYDQWKWSNNLQSYYGATISHSRTIGKLGVTGLFSYFQDDGYRKNDWEKRYSAYLKAAYNFSESTSLTFIGTGYSRNKGTFTYWKGLNDALLPPDNEIGQTIPSDRFVLGLLLNHMFNDKISLLIKPSLYNSYWYDASESANSSKSQLYRTEVQMNWKLAEGSLL
ncbi:MAG: TonB-dependent receptor, partial [Chlorobi bacterium]|nr:TonB-dependent receptor [Chlorobiota bacterium]